MAQGQAELIAPAIVGFETRALLRRVGQLGKPVGQLDAVIKQLETLGGAGAPCATG